MGQLQLHLEMQGEAKRHCELYSTGGFMACKETPTTTLCTEPTASPVPPWCLGEQVKLRVCLEGRGCVGVCREREGLGEETSCFAEIKLLGKPPSLYRCPASRMRQATAVMSAAPLPLPSSDCRKVTSHLGDNCFTVSCMTVEKLQGKGRERF